MVKGNIGDWSEVYTLLKIISDRNLYSGDENLNPVENLILPIVKVLRDESNGVFEFTYNRDMVVIKHNQAVVSIPVSVFREKAKYLLEQIKKPESAAFSIPEVEAFINAYNSYSLKAGSSVKSDIRVVIHDHRTGTTPELGFSIKSQIGSASTLLNAGRTTNFIYKIAGTKFSQQEIEEINSIQSPCKIKDRIEKIIEYGRSLEFVRTESVMFGNNLTLIDSSLVYILAGIVYGFYTSTQSRVVDLVREISDSNPLNYDQSTIHPFYEYKIKRFLTDVALGMMPSKVWSGKLEATGGYLVLKESGDIICYHIYNRNDFENYLLKGTKLETASSKRHDFGTLYETDGQQYFKLNLQIRFLK